MKLCLVLITLYALLSCGSAPVKSEQIGNQTFHNFNSRLKLFWNKAHDKDLDKQIELWDKYIEGKYHGIYKGIIWKRYKGTNPEIFKKLYLFATFEMYKANEKLIFGKDLDYIELTQKRIKHFKSHYPDADFLTDVMVLSMGLSQTIALASIYMDQNTYKRKTIVLLNSDLLSITPMAINKTLTHELFHVYFFEKNGLKNVEAMMKEGNMDLAKMLFIEGISVHGTNEIARGPKANMYIKGVENLLPKMKKLVTKEYAKIGLDVDMDKLDLDVSNITPFSHCGKVLKKDVQVNFSCEDIYRMGGKIIASLSKLYTFPKVLLFDEARINKEVRNFLKKSKKPKAASMLNHL